MAENKGKFVWLLVLILVLLIGGKATFYICEELKLNRERYEITAPMADFEYKKAIIEIKNIRLKIFVLLLGLRN